MEKQNPLDKRLIAVIISLALVIIVMGCFLFLRKDEVTIDDNDIPRIGYAAEAKVMLDQDSLQAAADEAQKNAREGMVALQYQNDAFSKDGKTFSCLIANSPSNLYDMFVTIFADAALTDQIFLSGLVPPGSGFEEINLDHKLEPGDHTVYVAITQVATGDDGEQTIKNQVMHTIEFHVAQ